MAIVIEIVTIVNSTMTGVTTRVTVVVGRQLTSSSTVTYPTLKPFGFT